MFYIIITPVISVTLTKIMYMSEEGMVIGDAIERIDSVLNAEPMSVGNNPQNPKDASVELENVHFSYDGKKEAVSGISLKIKKADKQLLLSVRPAAENQRLQALFQDFLM